jgi:hypothetical protein
MTHKYYDFYRERSVPTNNGWQRERALDNDKIRIIAEAEGYAMVRKKGCMPFVISSKDIVRKKPHDTE